MSRQLSLDYFDPEEKLKSPDDPQASSGVMTSFFFLFSVTSKRIHGAFTGFLRAAFAVHFKICVLSPPAFHLTELRLRKETVSLGGKYVLL